MTTEASSHTAAEIATADSTVPVGETDPEGGFTIVIPAYNEENGIAPTLQELLDELEKLELTVPYEVMVVNDGSSDATADRLQPFVDSGRITLIEHEVNQGYGAALKTGIRRAAHEWILITDADGTYPNVHIKDLLPFRADNDMVVGARTGEQRQISWIRRPPKWVLRKLASWLARRSIPDLNSGFRMMRKPIIKKFFNILPDGFSFTITITLAMLAGGYQVKYTPINYLKREGKSKIRPIADTLNFLKLIVRTIMYFDPLRVFLPLAGLFFLASIGVAAVSIGYGSFLDITTTLLFVTGVQLIAIGMLADLLNRRT